MPCRNKHQEVLNRLLADDKIVRLYAQSYDEKTRDFTSQLAEKDKTSQAQFAEEHQLRSEIATNQIALEDPRRLNISDILSDIIDKRRAQHQLYDHLVLVQDLLDRIDVSSDATSELTSNSTISCSLLTTSSASSENGKSNTSDSDQPQSEPPQPTPSKEPLSKKKHRVRQRAINLPSMLSEQRLLTKDICRPAANCVECLILPMHRTEESTPKKRNRSRKCRQHASIVLPHHVDTSTNTTPIEAPASVPQEERTNVSPEESRPKPVDTACAASDSEDDGSNASEHHHAEPFVQPNPMLGDDIAETPLEQMVRTNRPFSIAPTSTPAAPSEPTECSGPVTYDEPVPLKKSTIRKSPTQHRYKQPTTASRNKINYVESTQHTSTSSSGKEPSEETNRTKVPRGDVSDFPFYTGSSAINPDFNPVLHRPRIRIPGIPVVPQSHRFTPSESSQRFRRRAWPASSHRPDSTSDNVFLRAPDTLQAAFHP